ELEHLDDGRVELEVAGVDVALRGKTREPEPDDLAAIGERHGRRVILFLAILGAERDSETAAGKIEQLARQARIGKLHRALGFARQRRRNLREQLRGVQARVDAELAAVERLLQHRMTNETVVRVGELAANVAHTDIPLPI